MGRTKKLTILHANDFHGQISFKIAEDYTLVGGISLLSGYIKKVRSAEDAVFCAICGDILQDNIQNACSKGINTVKLLNLIMSDALSLGNHEMEYGLAHLLIFKECIRTPILCANLFVQPLDIHKLRLAVLVMRTNVFYRVIFILHRVIALKNTNTLGWFFNVSANR